MKSVILVIIASLCFFECAYGQYSFTEIDTDQEVLLSANSNSNYQTTLETCPIEKGTGLSACSKEAIYLLLEKNLIYPEAAREAGVEEQCEVYFSISKEGNINKTLIRTCHKSFEESINQVLSKLHFSNVEASSQKIYRLDINFSIHGI